MLTIPSTAISAFKRCPKSYDIAYNRMLTPKLRNDRMNEGIAIHAILAYNIGKNDEASTEKYNQACFEFPDMLKVVEMYLKHNPTPGNIIAIEEPIFTPIIPGVTLRTTLDLIYERAETGQIVVRDFKSFEKSPSFDTDLDFQARLFTEVVRRKYPNQDVYFEIEAIRNKTPGTKNSKGAWREEECYIRQPIYTSLSETADIWQETIWVAENILKTIEDKKFYRVPLQVGPHSCNSCSYRELCKREIKNGGLDQYDLEELSIPRDPITLH